MGAHVLIADNITLANQPVTLAFVNPPTSGLKEIEILRVEIGYNGGTTAGQVRLQLVTQASAYPTLVSVDPAKLDLGGADSLISGNTTGAAGTCGINASAEGAGTKTVRYTAAFNRPTGYLWVPTLDDRIILPVNAGEGFGVYLPAAQTGVLSGWHCALIWKERF